MEGWEFAVVAGVLLLLFGGSRLPKLARSLGEARTEMDKVRKELTGDEPEPAAAEAAPAEPAAAMPAAAPSLQVESVVVAEPPRPLLAPPLPPPGA